MKRLIYILSVVIILCSCQKSNEDKAKEIVKQHLKENLNDWNSYEPISFSPLDSVFSVMEIDPDIIAAESKLKLFDRPFSLSTSMLETWKEDTVKYAKAYKEELSNWKMLNDSVFYYKSIVDSLKSNYQPRFEGFIIRHKYRANNENGVKLLYDVNFYLDILLSSVVDSDEK
ncbi:hypothetical protein HMPREF1076_04480 [Parabacteroides goldsteinii CL02T12C30]|uniref:Uncharacterized protein n=1 Tax=Parabacteroides goldsteinii CL02T12C30 TaxID=999418 RepID=K5ZDG6_9BACT|nr:hypothetical protein [Parabacteroides goldsteinii]EKN09451.1 hypothetical protein HMPREF1076_04480 [Parabacteroides goldsteinii CL02T12C30]